MTDTQVHAFNKDLCELMRRHGLRGVAGVCIDSTGDGSVMDLHDGCSPVKEIIRHFVDLLEGETRKMGIIGDRELKGIDLPHKREN